MEHEYFKNLVRSALKSRYKIHDARVTERDRCQFKRKNIEKRNYDNEIQIDRIRTMK